MENPEVNLGLVGVGPVNQTVLDILPEYNVDVGELRIFASEKSEGKKFQHGDDEFTLRHARSAEDFHGLDAVIVAAGGEATKTAVSSQVRPWIEEAGAVDIDKSSAFRHEEGVPLVVAGVNSEALRGVRRGDTVAVPNCTTTIGLLALKPLHDAAGLKSLRVTTIQSVSGQGQNGIEETFATARELLDEGVDDLLSGKVRENHPLVSSAFPVATPAFNVVPFAGTVDAETGKTSEEQKFINESRKILGMEDLPVTATCTRSMVATGHSEAINAEFEEDISPEEAREILRSAYGIRLVDEPHALAVAGLDEVLVGRIRKDDTRDNTLDLWAVGDNLRPGAATNGARILEFLANQGF